MARTNVLSGAPASTDGGSSGCTVVTLAGTNAGNASGRGSIQVTRNGRGASAITSARPTWPSNPLPEVPSYAVTNVGISYLDILPGVTAQLVINNIFNTTYADPGVRTADNTRFASSIPQPGRSIFVKLLTRQFF